MLFTGHSEHTIDAKQRLAIPKKHRDRWDPERDGKGWYAVPWPTGVIRLYTENHFVELASQRQHSLTPNTDEAELEAELFGSAERLDMDSTWRIKIPREHLEDTGLGGEVVIVGALNRLEVHDRAKWRQSRTERFRKLPELVQRIEARRAGT